MNVTGKTLSNVVQNVVCHVKNTAGKKEIVCFRFPTNLEMERKQADRQTECNLTKETHAQKADDANIHDNLYLPYTKPACTDVVGLVSDFAEYTSLLPI